MQKWNNNKLKDDTTSYISRPDHFRGKIVITEAVAKTATITANIQKRNIII